MVAGVAALMLSVNPYLTPSEISNILTTTAIDLNTPAHDYDTGWGCVDAPAAVKKAATNRLEENEVSGVGSEVKLMKKIIFEGTTGTSDLALYLRYTNDT